MSIKSVLINAMGCAAISLVELLILWLIPGCAAANSPDEFSPHGFYGQIGGRSSSTSGLMDRPAFAGGVTPRLGSGTSSGMSDSDFWMVGGTLAWYLEQPNGPVINRHGHPLREHRY